jgi:hypothetical protein
MIMSFHSLAIFKNLRIAGNFWHHSGFFVHLFMHTIWGKLGWMRFQVLTAARMKMPVCWVVDLDTVTQAKNSAPGPVGNQTLVVQHVISTYAQNRKAHGKFV